MSTEVGSAHYDLDLSAKKFNDGMKKAQGDLKGFLGSLKNAEAGSKKFAGVLAGLSAGVVGLVGGGLKIAGELETLEVALKTVTGSSDEARRAMNKIKQTAIDSPFFETRTLAQFTQLMAASGQEIDNAVQSAIRFGDVAAAFGKSNAEMTRMGNTLSQVIGKGRADIVDFKELVNAGWVSVRKDVAESMQVTMTEFENMVSAGQIGYEQISAAAEKFAGSADEQADNLNSIWNRLKESASTALSDIIIDTGIFDSVKNAAKGLITTLDELKPELIKGISDFMAIMKENAPIVAGAIIGGLTPAFYGLATALWATYAPLLPFIAAGALIGFWIKFLIDSFGGFGAVLDGLKEPLAFFGHLFDEIVGPSIRELSVMFREELLPELQKLWEVLKPILIPVLKGVAFAFSTVLVVGIRAFLEVLELLIDKVTGMVKIIRTAVETIVAIFTGNFEKIGETIEKVKDKLNNLNPFHRNSPSLVDNVMKGVGIIKDQYDSLTDVTLPSVSSITDDITSLFSGGLGGGLEQNVYVNVGSVRDQGDIQALGREFGYRTAINPAVTGNRK